MEEVKEMKRELLDLFVAPTEDRDFPKKFALAVLAAIGLFLLLPGLILLGYLAELVEMKSKGKPGLPEWNDPKALGLRGAFCAPVLIYLLPGTIVIAIGAIASSSGGRTVLGISFLSAFIILGGILLTFIGNAVAFTAIHSYVNSKNFVELFSVPQIVKKLTGKATEMAKLFGAGTFASLLFLTASTYLGWIGAAVSLLGSSFLSLAIAGGVGTIYGKAEPASAEEAYQPANDGVQEASGEEWLPEAGADDIWKPT